MLILSRKRDQAIVIDDQIVITVVQVDRGRVQIGISAPRHISIHRQEIYRRIECLTDGETRALVESACGQM